MGTMPRWENEPVISIILVAQAAVGVLFSAWLTYLELAVINAICIWCVTSAVIVLVILVVSVADSEGMRAGPRHLNTKQGAEGSLAEQPFSFSVGAQGAGF